MKMSSPRGHSNAHVDQISRWDSRPDKAKIPMEGGASVHTVKSLPPLALDREEWKTIGRAMGWICDSRIATVCTHGKVAKSGPVALSSGRTVVHLPMCNGAQSAEIQSGAAMTEAEWIEYSAIIANRTT